MALDGKSMARCLKPNAFGNTAYCTLCHFWDASESGYGQSSYIRLVNKGEKCIMFCSVGKSNSLQLQSLNQQEQHYKSSFKVVEK